MDAAGKDGAIKHVMSGVNPQGCQVFSFSHPSAEELDHDFLWRTTRCLPERGRIGIFNRSYYEVLLQIDDGAISVLPEILRIGRLLGQPLGAQDLGVDSHDQHYLHRNGTRIVKFFLHLSQQEQRKRLLKRIDEPHKKWKFSLADVAERRLWKQYMKAYEACLSATSTADAPWHVVPADDKHNARLIISSIIHETLQGLRMTYPKLDTKRQGELRKIRKLLAK